jgi:hypothetical protein
MLRAKGLEGLSDLTTLIETGEMLTTRLAAPVERAVRGISMRSSRKE